MPHQHAEVYKVGFPVASPWKGQGTVCSLHFNYSINLKNVDNFSAIQANCFFFTNQVPEGPPPLLCIQIRKLCHLVAEALSQKGGVRGS